MMKGKGMKGKWKSPTFSGSFAFANGGGDTTTGGHQAEAGPILFHLVLISGQELTRG